MFWNKKKKENAKSGKDSKQSAPPSAPGFKQNSDGSFSLSFDEGKPAAQPKCVTDRLYVISRGNIDLKEAQNITMHAAMNRPELAGNLLPDNHVDLVWCSAYPDALFGEYDLTSLLVEYVNKSEGEKYLNSSSQVIPVQGKKDGDEYLVLMLVHLE